MVPEAEVRMEGTEFEVEESEMVVGAILKKEGKGPKTEILEQGKSREEMSQV